MNDGYSGKDKRDNGGNRKHEKEEEEMKRRTEKSLKR